MIISVLNGRKIVKVCDVIASCQWEVGCLRQQKLTKFTASAFVVTTKNVFLLQTIFYTIMISDMYFLLYFPRIHSKSFFVKLDSELEEIFILILMMSYQQQKLKDFTSLLKKHIVPVDGEVKNICTYCDFVIHEDDLNLIVEFNIDCTQGLLDSTYILKHKVDC